MSTEAWPSIATGWIGLVQRRTMAVEVVALFGELTVPFAVLTASALVTDAGLLGRMDVIDVTAAFTFKDGRHLKGSF